MTGIKAPLLTCLFFLGYFTWSAEAACVVSSKWLDATCENNSTCAELNAECYNGLCKCSPGYYYSLSTKTCLSACEPSKLTWPFQEYKGSFLHLNDIVDSRDVTRGQCLQGCMDNAYCLSVDYTSVAKVCHQKGVTALTARTPGGYKPPGWVSTYDHYQKSCA